MNEAYQAYTQASTGQKRNTGLEYLQNKWQETRSRRYEKKPLGDSLKQLLKDEKITIEVKAGILASLYRSECLSRMHFIHAPQSFPKETLTSYFQAS